MEDGLLPDEKRAFTLHCAALHLTVEFSLRPGESARLGSAPEMEISLPMAGIAAEAGRLWCGEDGALWMALPDGTPVRNPSHLSAGPWHFIISAVEPALQLPLPPAIPVVQARDETAAPRQLVPPPLPVPRHAPMPPGHSTLLPGDAAYPPHEISHTPGLPQRMSGIWRKHSAVIISAAGALAVAAGSVIWLSARSGRGSRTGDQAPLPASAAKTPAKAPPNTPVRRVETRPKDGDGDALSNMKDGSLQFDPKKLETELRDTVLFCLRMKNTLASLPEAFPDLRTETGAAEEAWRDSVFHTASRAAEENLRKEGHSLFQPAAAKLLKESTLPEKFSRAAEVETFLRKVQDCAAGKFPRPVMRGHLLRMHPAFADHPEQEFEAGFVFRETNTSLQKTDVQFLVPITWRARPVSSEYPMARYDLQYGSGPAACMMFFLPLSTATGSPATADAWVRDFTRDDAAKSVKDTTCVITAFEKSTSNGHPVVSCSYQTTVKGEGGNVYRAGQVIRVAKKDSLVEFHLTTDSWQDAVSARQNLETLQPVLHKIAESVAFVAPDRRR